MRLRNMLRLCLVFWKSEPHYAYKHYAYKRKNMYLTSGDISWSNSYKFYFQSKVVPLIGKYTSI